MPGARAAAVLLLVAALLAPPAGATMVGRMPLDRVAREADRIVHGTVTDIRSGRDESGLPATWITLAVTETLKGEPAAGVTVKQYGVSEPLPDGTIARVAGLPHYAVGEEVILFLHGVSRRGFTSPVGFGQGAYRVDRRAARPAVRSDMPGSSRDLDRFLSDVRRLAGAGR